MTKHTHACFIKKPGFAPDVNSTPLVRQYGIQPTSGGCSDGGVLPFGAALLETKTEVPRETSVLERKKELTDMKLSRLLQKPWKRNGVSFF